MKKRFLATAMALVCAISMTACGSNDDTPNPTSGAKPTEGAGAPTQGGEENPGQQQEEVKSTLPDTLANPNLIIVWDKTQDSWDADLADGDPTNDFHKIYSTKEAFEKKYGGKVEIIAVGWGEQQGQVISMVNGGEACDLVMAHDQNFPTYGAKGIVQDVSQYVDLNDDFWNKSVTEAFSLNGVPYAFGAEATPVVIAYNKTLFDQNGQKTPMEYFNEGNWTWDTFREVALNMTGDTDGDGEPDIYGFGWWDSFYVQMLGANGTNTINYSNPKDVHSNYTTPQGTEVFTFLQNGYVTDKFIWVPDGDKFIANYKSGKLAMTAEYGFAAITAFSEGCDYELAWAPLPTGPSGQKYDCGGALNGFAIPVTSKNPEGAAVFARMASELQLEHNKTMQLEKYGQEQVDLMNTLAEHINFAPIGIEKYWDANWTLFSGMRDGVPVSTFTTNAEEQIVEGAKVTLGE